MDAVPHSLVVSLPDENAGFSVLHGFGGTATRGDTHTSSLLAAIAGDDANLGESRSESSETQE